MKRIAAFILLLVICTLSAACKSSTERSVVGFAMGSDYYVEYTSSSSFDDEIGRMLSSIEGSFSVSVQGSIVARINQASEGEKITLTAEERAVLERCFDISERSNGAFLPSLRPLVTLWGFDPPDYEMNGKVPPSGDRIAEILPLTSLDLFTLTEDGALVKSATGAALDLGGAIKGYAAEKVRDLLVEKTVKEALVYVGGTIAAVGRDYVIGVTAPRESKEEYALRFTLCEGEICATSGDYERYYLYEGERYHHILNGETGYPASSGIISATVISSDGLLADALATAVVVLGEEAGLALVRACGARAILITEGKQVITSGVEVTIKDGSYALR